jgi:hypothetical protein
VYLKVYKEVWKMGFGGCGSGHGGGFFIFFFIIIILLLFFFIGEEDTCSIN